LCSSSGSAMMLADGHARIQRSPADPERSSACAGAGCAGCRGRHARRPRRRHPRCPGRCRKGAGSRGPTVDLPQPDSPTRPSVSPRAMSKLIPSTALMSPTCRRNMPAWIGKYIERSHLQSGLAALVSPSRRRAALVGQKAGDALCRRPAIVDQRRILRARSGHARTGSAPRKGRRRAARSGSAAGRRMVRSLSARSARGSARSPAALGVGVLRVARRARRPARSRRPDRHTSPSPGRRCRR
jgi:hypothetical protein